MFFGKGDSSKLNDDEQKVLSNLRRMVETGHIIALAPDQSVLAIEMIDWFMQWKSVLRLGASLRNVALLLTGLLTIWWVGQDWFIGFIQRVAGK